MKPATNVTMTTPPLSSAARRMSSGTLRFTSQSARAEECEKITGAFETRSASSIVPSDTCDKSTSMPSLFISSTTCSPNGVRPPCSGGCACESAQLEVHVVRQRHVAHAEVVVRAQRAERVLDRVTAFHAEERSDLAGLVGGADVGHRGRELQAIRILRDDPPRDIDLFELRARESALELAGDVHGPELRTDATVSQTREVRLRPVSACAGRMP